MFFLMKDWTLLCIWEEEAEYRPSTVWRLKGQGRDLRLLIRTESRAAGAAFRWFCGRGHPAGHRSGGAKSGHVTRLGVSDTLKLNQGNLDVVSGKECGCTDSSPVVSIRPHTEKYTPIQRPETVYRGFSTLRQSWVLTLTWVKSHNGLNLLKIYILKVVSSTKKSQHPTLAKNSWLDAQRREEWTSDQGQPPEDHFEYLKGFTKINRRWSLFFWNCFFFFLNHAFTWIWNRFI